MSEDLKKEMLKLLDENVTVNSPTINSYNVRFSIIIMMKTSVAALATNVMYVELKIIDLMPAAVERLDPTGDVDTATE